MRWLLNLLARGRKSSTSAPTPNQQWKACQMVSQSGGEQRGTPMWGTPQSLAPRQGQERKLTR